MACICRPHILAIILSAAAAMLLCQGSSALFTIFKASNARVPAQHAMPVTAALSPNGTHGNAATILGTAFGLGTVGAVLMAGNRRHQSKSEKTQVRYSTEVILPNLMWLNTGLKSNEIAPGEIYGVAVGGMDLCIGKTEGGDLFAIGDKMPPTGTSLSVGGRVEGDLAVEDQFGSKFNVFDGQPVEWCPSPVGSLIGVFMGGPQMIPIFPVQTTFLGSDIQVQVDTNARKAYEANYWKGFLDAQGKNDGTWY